MSNGTTLAEIWDLFEPNAAGGDIRRLEHESSAVIADLLTPNRW
jgi:hypothetical protein